MALTVVASILAFFAVFAIWVSRQLLETDKRIAAIERLARLRDSGALTPEEFEREKALIVKVG
jgi:Short C-terminal domain